MLAFGGLTWWMKPEYLEETINLGRVTTSLPHTNAKNQTQATVVKSKGPGPKHVNGTLLKKKFELLK